MKPRHYLEQFHPAYSDNEDYSALLEATQDYFRNPDHPVITAWGTQSMEAGVRAVLVRTLLLEG